MRRACIDRSLSYILLVGIKAGFTMQDDNRDMKTAGGSAFYTYGGNAEGVQDAAPEPGGSALRPSGQAEAGNAEPKLPEAYGREFPEPDLRQKRRLALKGALGALLFAAAICALAFACLKLGILGEWNLSIAAPQGSPQIYDAKALNFASLFLNSQQWDKKSHGSLKSLGKIKNLKVALDFFERYPPSEIAALPRRPSSIDDAIDHYADLAGTIVSIEATVTRKYAVTESLLPDSGAPSTLLSLQTDRETGASMLVIGSSPDNAKEGETVTFACLPVYLYAPGEDLKSGGIFFVTLPELVGGPQ